MNFKNIALVLFTLLPMVSFCNEVENRIKELREARVSKSMEILERMDLVIQRCKAYWDYRKAVEIFWDKKMATEEDHYGEFLVGFRDLLYSGKETDQFLEKKPLNKDNMADLKFSLVRISILGFVYEEAIIQYMESLNELAAINREMAALE